MTKSNEKVVELRPATPSEPSSRLLQRHSEARLRLAKLIRIRSSTVDRIRALPGAGREARLCQLCPAEPKAEFAAGGHDVGRGRSQRRAWRADQ